MLASCSPSNAAPEWQAGRLRRRSRKLVATCPLEGLVRMLGHLAQGVGKDTTTYLH